MQLSNLTYSHKLSAKNTEEVAESAELLLNVQDTNFKLTSFETVLWEENLFSTLTTAPF